jgi:REP-associated tyrosine transposase
LGENRCRAAIVSSPRPKGRRKQRLCRSLPISLDMAAGRSRTIWAEISSLRLGARPIRNVRPPVYAAGMKKPVQLPFPPRGRGGARPGAGRPRGLHVSHHGRAGSARPAPYHAVWHTADDVASLRGKKLFRQVRESFRRCHEKEGFRVVHFSVQGNHLHALVEADSVEELSRGMQGLGVSMAKRINVVSGRKGHAFDDRFFARSLRSPREVANAVQYVLRNHEVHARRMGCDVSSPAPDAWSSAGCAAEPPLTSPARTWLLAVGWHRARPMCASG